MNISGLLSGILMVLIGFLLFGIFVFTGDLIGGLVLLVPGIIMICLGVYMILNREKEDKIEQVNYKNSRDLNKK